jgi:anti-sigma B factor antagonist
MNYRKEGMSDHQADALREQPVREVSSSNGAVVVRLAGELDLYNAPIVREALLECAARDPERVVVDLSDVDFLDSTALGVLVETRSRLPNRRALLLAGARPEARRALEVSGLDRHLRVYESVDEALAAPL